MIMKKKLSKGQTIKVLYGPNEIITTILEEVYNNKVIVIINNQLCYVHPSQVVIIN